MDPHAISPAFELDGEPGGLDAVGGLSFDHRILEHLGRSRLAANNDWSKLIAPPLDDGRWLRARSQLMSEVRGAKERLSTARVTRLWVPELNQEYQLSRDELEPLIAPDIDATVEVLARTITDAKLRPSQLAGMYLVGASSRIPLIANTLWKRLALQPETEDDPKAVVALGATEWHPQESSLR